MQDDEPLDTTLLVATALGHPDMAYAALYSPVGEFFIYATPIGLIISAIVIWVVYRSGGSDKVTAVMGALGLIGGWIKWVVVVGVLLYPTYKIWKAAGGRPGSEVTHHLFTKDGIEVLGADSSSLLPWANFSRVIETTKGFLFYQQGKITTFVPRRCLAGAAEIAIVRKFIGKNVANAKLLA